MSPAEHLAKFFNEHPEIKQEAFAKSIGVSQSMVSQWLSCSRPISMSRAEIIEEIYKIDGGSLCPLLKKLRDRYGNGKLNSILKVDALEIKDAA